MFGLKTVVLIVMLGGVDSVAAAVVVIVVVVVGVPDSTMLRTIWMSLAVEFLTFPVELWSLGGVSNENRGVLDSLLAILNSHQKQHGGTFNFT